MYLMNTANNNTAIVSVRTTFDGARVHLHANGEISGRTNFVHGGKLPAATMWRVWSDVCSYTFDELPALIRAAKKAKG